MRFGHVNRWGLPLKLFSHELNKNKYLANNESSGALKPLATLTKENRVRRCRRNVNVKSFFALVELALTKFFQ